MALRSAGNAQNNPPISAYQGGENMNEQVTAARQEEATRGTFGFIQCEDESTPRGGAVIHTFGTGKFAGMLLVHYWGHKHNHAIVGRDDFKPSRDAYFCEGSYVTPMWEGDSCRCTNYWAKQNYMTRDGEIVFVGGKPVLIDANCATNIMTDEEALKIYGPFVVERRIASNVDFQEALTGSATSPSVAPSMSVLSNRIKNSQGSKLCLLCRLTASEHWRKRR
jgi:hypothetical protein